MIDNPKNHCDCCDQIHAPDSKTPCYHAHLWECKLRGKDGIVRYPPLKNSFIGGIKCFFGNHDRELEEEKKGKGFITGETITYHRRLCSRCGFPGRWIGTEIVGKINLHNIDD